ncbi:MAG: dehydrogenase [Clostridiales bacterium]|jgi:2-oxoisovalerate dehydrogenase E1 component|nr:dehydrogenase [Clostridiales bacterium]
MTKSILIDPAQMRGTGTIQFHDIPVNTYQKRARDEKTNFTKKEFLNIYRDMCYIREFETMLNFIKVQGKYEGVAYTHPGPAHLGIGQEAAYVGGAYHLTLDDYSFGSHRSHGEILAKGLRMTETLPADKLLSIMQDFFEGHTLNVVNTGKSVRETARDFLLYGMMCEVFARKNGFNKGLGGSMHAFFTPFGIYPNNAIVGGSGPISVGAALYKRVNHKDGVVICSIGDGSMACGPVWEGMMMAAMDQMKTLWKGGNGVPIIFHVNNNFYGMGGQTRGETMGYESVARVAAGISPTQLYAERVDGYNPLAVIDAYKRKLPVAKRNGPVLLDIVTYRIAGHSPSDSGSYRTEEEVASWQRADSIVSFGNQLLDGGICADEELDQIWNAVKADMLRNLQLAIDDEVSPRIDIFGKEERFISEVMFSNSHKPSMDTSRQSEMLCPKEECPRVQQIKKKSRFALDATGKPISKNRLYQLRDGIAEPIINKFYEDPTLAAFGEDVRDWGGAFAVYRGMTEAVPYHRLFNTPIAEAGIVGAAVGYAMCGGRAVAELMYCDFLGRAGDEVFNQLSKWQSMSAGMLRMPVVLRMSVGSKYGAQHSQDWSALVSHIPGLKVVFPATPYDAKGLMQSALNGTDPVIFLESQRIYDVGEQFYSAGVPEDEYEIPLGEPDIKRAGNDVTILSIGAVLYRVLDAAKELSRIYGLEAEVIDARSLVPFNYEKVMESVKKTGRIVLVGDACERNSVMRGMASNITELCFDYLDAPPTVVGAKNWITPAHELEDAFFPQPHWIIDAIHERLLPLKGHVCRHNFTQLEQLRENKRGI